ncbi:MAG: cell division protein FtsQ [Pseudonocardiales bacterium]|nr:cell division protein FtsQ [Pseudonocardiales bacterium]
MIGLQDPPVARSAQRGPIRRWMVVLAVAVALLSLIWLVGFSRVLGASNVTVRGTKLLSAQQVRAAAAIEPGTPLIRLNTSAVQRRIESLPAVRSARVSTTYPTTVTITVIERVAVGYRSTSSGIVGVDAGNVEFRKLAGPPRGLPQLGASGGPDADTAVAAVAAALTPGLRPLVATVSASTPESVTLRLADGRTVLWGGTDRNADKAKLLSVLLKQPGTYFDISDPDTVISRGGN